MAICCRKGCNLNIDPVSYEHKVRLCYIHFNKRKELSHRRNVKKEIRCKVCGADFSETRNNKYCSNKCKGIGMRILKEAEKIEVYHHSYWLNVECFIKNNPLQLNSINSLEDMAEIINLYKFKSRLQFACSHFLGRKILSKHKKNEHKLIPFIKIDLSHKYPNSKGGMNVVGNIMIAPSFINKMNKDKIPENNAFQEFNGKSANKKRKDIRCSLVNAITKNYSEDEINAMFYKIGKLPRLKNGQKRNLDVADTFNQVIIFELLKKECKRLELKDYLYCLKFVDKLLRNKTIKFRGRTITFFPCYLDMISLAFFHAYLRGDPDCFLSKFKDFVRAMDNGKTTMRRVRALFSVLAISRRYCKKYFSISSADLASTKETILTVYAKFFTVKPSYISDEGYPRWIR
ncbi:TPA: hypothetical protein U2Q94_002042 [Enterobacter hormaechei]|nr:hypothetical protein [Enterobacter hormaechei]